MAILPCQGPGPGLWLAQDGVQGHYTHPGDPFCGTLALPRGTTPARHQPQDHPALNAGPGHTVVLARQLVLTGAYTAVAGGYRVPGRGARQCRTGSVQGARTTWGETSAYAGCMRGARAAILPCGLGTILRVVTRTGLESGLISNA